MGRSGHLLAGGALTEAHDKHWIFFVNVPIGLAAMAFGRILIPQDQGIGLEHGVDWLGSFLVTVSLMTAVYAIVQATNHGHRARGRSSGSAASPSCSWACSCFWSRGSRTPSCPCASCACAA